MASHPYDIKLTIAPGGAANTHGFMLVSPPNETKTLNIEEVGGPNPERMTTADAASYADYAPDKDVAFAMSDFSGGVGQLEFDDGDETAVWWASGVVLHVPGKVYLAPPASTLSLSDATALPGGYTTYETGGTRYDFCWSGKRIYRRDASNATNTWSVVYTQPDDLTVTDFKIFNGLGIIAFPGLSGSPDYATATTLTGTWSVTTRNVLPFSAGTRPKFVLPVRGTLFAAVDTAKVFYSVDPTVDGWAGPIVTTVSSLEGDSVGDGTYPFVNLFAANDYLYAFTTAAGYSIDGQQIVTETFWQWKDKPSTENFKFVTSGGDLLYYSVGPEVYGYDPGTGQNLSLRMARRSGFSTQEVLGLAADNQYVYILARVRVPHIRSGSSIALFRAWRKSAAQWALEVLWEEQTPSTNTYGPLTAVPYGVGTRLYWGMKVSSAISTYVMDVDPDWDESTRSAFQTTGTVYTSLSRSNFPGLVKKHLYITTEADNLLTATRTLGISRTLDNGQSFASIGTSVAVGSETFNLTNLSSRSVGLSFTLTGDGTTTPLFRAFAHHQRVRFKYLPAITAGVRIAHNIEMNNGSRDKRTPQQYKAALEALRTTDSQITYEDFLGHNFTVTVDRYNFRPTRHEVPENRAEMEALVLISRADSGA